MCKCPMVVSQWGLNSNQDKTGPGHSMVVSQWSSSEHRVPSQPGAQVPTLEGARAQLEGGARVASATDYLAHKGPPSEVPVHGQRRGGVAAATDSSGKVHGELSNP